MTYLLGISGWRKSSRSVNTGCIEFTVAGEDVMLRDSKDPTGPVLRFSPMQWRIFLEAVKQPAEGFK
jgi:hypothetical protein